MAVVWDTPVLDIAALVIAVLGLILTLYTSNLFSSRLPTYEEHSRRHQELLHALGKSTPTGTGAVPAG